MNKEDRERFERVVRYVERGDLTPREKAMGIFTMFRSYLSCDELSKKDGNTIRRWRLAKGYKQEYVAQVMGVAQPTISKIESGKRCLYDHERAALEREGLNWEVYGKEL